MKPLKKNRTGWIGLGLGILLSTASPALACEGGHGGWRSPPPEEALSACSGATVNQSCQFEAPHGTLTGTCQNIQNQMVCVPAGGPPPQEG